MNDQAAVLAILTRISAQLDALPAAIAAASQRRSPLGNGDREALARLLPAIRAAVGDATFAARDLFQRPVEYAGLQEALEHVLGAAEPGRARRLGALFRRAAGFDEGGFHVERLGASRDGAIWQVRES